MVTALSDPSTGWLPTLLDRQMPGAAPDAPRPGWGWLAAATAVGPALAAGVYAAGLERVGSLQALWVLLGLVLVAGTLRLGIGPGWLAPVRGRTVLVLGLALTAHLAMWYLGRRDAWSSWGQLLFPAEGPMAPLVPFLYVAGCATLLRLVVPVIVARRLLGLELRELGLWSPGGSGLWCLWPVYSALYLLLLPLLIAASQTTSFLARYPLCRELAGADGSLPVELVAVYALAYAMLFVSGEGLWRGILLFGAERDLGVCALPIMVLPYVTSHFGKPLPETVGAAVAGTVLGWLALKHRSIWLGVALHVAVAATMDLLAAAANGMWLR